MRMQITHLILFFLLLPVLSNAQTWIMVWSDEFNYTGIPDPQKWDYESGASIRNKELQFYTKSRLQNARVENGTLIIEARKETYDVSNYTSASVISKDKGEWLYGKIEVRAKLPDGVGTWPAIWMLPSKKTYGGWPSSGEIDIMECVGFDPKRVHFNIHTEAYNHVKKTNKGKTVLLPDPQNNFHSYIVEWYPDRLDFFVDNNKVFSFSKEADDYKVWPYNKPFYLIMNIAIGGGWGGQKGVDDTIFPQKMTIDYVRVYQMQ